MEDDKPQPQKISMDELDARIQVHHADELVQKTLQQLASSTFDLLEFVKALDTLNENERDVVLTRLAWRYPGPKVLTNQPLDLRIKFFEFLDSKNYIRPSHDREVMGFLTDLKNDETELFVYLFKNLQSLQEPVIRKLAENEAGLDELEKLASEADKKYQEIITLVLGDVLVPGFMGSYVNLSPNHYAHPKIKTFLHNLVDPTGTLVSYIASRALYMARSLSVEDVEKLLKSSDYRQRYFALESYKRVGVNVEDAKSHIPAIVELLEDERLDVSKSALNVIGYFAEDYSSLIADVILDLLIVRSNNRPQEFFNSGVVVSALKETIKFNPRLQGTLLHNVRDVAVKATGSTRNRAVFVGTGINKKEFLALIGEIQNTNPLVAKSIADIVSGSIEVSRIADQISETDPKDIQQNAANQISLLTKYYENGLLQAKSSFNWAIGITVASILSFIAIALLYGKNPDKTIVWLTGFSSILADFIAATLLYIYQKTLSQLNNYNRQMSKIQDFLLANSFIESMNQDTQDSARMELVRSITSTQANSLLMSKVERDLKK